MSFLQEHADKLNPLSNDVNRYLRLIRMLDKRIQSIQAALIPQQKQFQLKLKSLKEGKVSQQQLKPEYESIVAKQKQVYGYAQEKVAISDQLVALVKDEYNYIKTDLKNKIKENKPADQQNQQVPKKKKPKPDSNNKQKQQQEQFLYDANDVKYCYCNRGSFGEMVGCEHPYCEKQWFHVECVEQKSSVIGNNDWFCNDCIKLKEKFKKSAIKQFL